MTKQKTRTYARNRSKSSELFSRKGRERIYDNDGSFFLEIGGFCDIKCAVASSKKSN